MQKIGDIDCKFVMLIKSRCYDYDLKFNLLFFYFLTKILYLFNNLKHKKRKEVFKTFKSNKAI